MPPMNDEALSADLIYSLELTDPARHMITVVCRIENPDPAGQIVSLPAWIPGSYLMREFAKHITAIAASERGAPVGLHKLDKSSFQIAPCDGPLVVRASIYAHDLSVRGAFVDGGHAFLNPACLCLRVHGQEDEPCLVQTQPPEGVDGWSVATALERRTGEPGQFGVFAAQNYDALIDRPLLMGPLTTGEFTVAGVPHSISLCGGEHADVDRLAADLALVCAWQADLFGLPLPMSRYDFLVMVQDSGYGGLEHRDSSALICARRDLPVPSQQEVTSGYRKFLGLASHEYFHLWNIKRIRPAGLTPYRLDRENYTRQLWLFEGITSYYDDLALLRSGLLGVQGYLRLVGENLTRVYRSRGRRAQTLEDASFDAWVKFYRPDENSGNATVSYYAKGAMVALALDLELRLRTDNDVSLDDVMRALWRDYGGVGRALPAGAFERLTEELCGQSMAEFFDQNLRSTVDPPVGILLAQFGVHLQLRAAESDADRGGQAPQREGPARPWLGISMARDGEQLKIRQVAADGPAAAAGVSPGDELIAINGWRVDAANPAARFAELAVGEPGRLSLFRRGRLIELEVAPSRSPRDTAWLSLDAGADEASLNRRELWLGS